MTRPASTLDRRAAAPTPARTAAGSSALEVFGALLHRDLAVAVRDLPTSIGQVVIQPLFLLLVFGKILPELGYTERAYADILFPGIVALTVVLTALQGTALPLVIELSYTMELEDRLLAPLPTSLVAVEKVVFASMRAMVAGALMFPVGFLMLGSIPWRASATLTALVVMLLGAFTGASMGLVLGTVVPPNRIQTMFALVLTPLMFTGSSQYPWSSLDELRWFQVLSAANPLTYVSEGLRGAMEPAVPHLATAICLVVLVAFLTFMLWIGIRGFRRRTIL